MTIDLTYTTGDTIKSGVLQYGLEGHAWGLLIDDYYWGAFLWRNEQWVFLENSADIFTVPDNQILIDIIKKNLEPVGENRCVSYYR